MLPLAGKVAVTTGGAGGIGSATARPLAEQGAKVVIADKDLVGAKRLALDINNRGGTALATDVDLAHEEQVQAMIRTTLETFGGIDILHNNAADLSPDSFVRDLDVESMDVEVWDRIFRVNVRGTMLCCKYALPHMRPNAGASIINMASNLGMQGNLIQAAYSASKAAIIQLTRSIATSHGKLGIRCNAISPGLVMTDNAANNVPAGFREIVESETLTPYLGTPRDIACAVAFLASDEARYINGQNLVVDGGTTSHIPGITVMRKLFSPMQ